MVIFPRLVTHTRLTSGVVLWWLLVAWDHTVDHYIQFTCSMYSMRSGTSYVLSHNWYRGMTSKCCHYHDKERWRTGDLLEFHSAFVRHLGFLKLKFLTAVHFIETFHVIVPNFVEFGLTLQRYCNFCIFLLKCKNSLDNRA